MDRFIPIIGKKFLTPHYVKPDLAQSEKSCCRAWILQLELFYYYSTFVHPESIQNKIRPVFVYLKTKS
jgi:hypothetical protein